MALSPDGYLLTCGIDEVSERRARADWARMVVADRADLRNGRVRDTLDAEIKASYAGPRRLCVHRRRQGELYCLSMSIAWLLIVAGGLIMADNTLRTGGRSIMKGDGVDTKAIRAVSGYLRADEIDLSSALLGGGLTLARQR